MNTPVSKRPLARAVAHLNSVVEVARSAPDRPLPGVRALSRDAGVALVTMVRAVAMAKAAGAVVTVPGRGTFAVAGDHHVSAPTVRPAPRVELRWELAARRLRHDLVSRVFPPDRPLPTAKELAARYGVCVPTIRKALRHLVETGALQLEPGGMRPGLGGDRHMRASVCMIVPGLPDHPFETLPERDHALLRALAAECRARGIHLDFCFAEYSGADRVRPDRSYESYAQVWPGTTFLGFAVLSLAFHRQALLGLLRECTVCGHPAVVLDETMATGPGDLDTVPNTHAVRFATSRECGLAVGRHLVALGHRHIAYLHRDPFPSWSQTRYGGLRECLAEAGVEGQVFAVGVDAGQPGGPAVDDLLRAIAARPLKPPRRQAAMRRALERLGVPLANVWREEMQRAPLHRALSELLRRKEVTAWVAESGPLAVRCLRYLRERRVRVPQALSVAGFDDSMESQLAGCTSFDFDMQSVARETMDLLLALPQASGRRALRREVEVPGFLTVRSSSGPAPQSRLGG